MFGLKFIRNSEWDSLKEEVTSYKRKLEDVGWTNLSHDLGNNQNAVLSENFKEMINRCKVVYYNNPMIGLWIHLTTAFVFGEGISNPQCEDKNVQKVIDTFWNDEDNQRALTSFTAQQLLSNKLQYEGNLFFVLFDDDAGNVKVRILNTQEVDDIVCDPEDRMRENYFKVRAYDRSFDFMSNSWSVKNNGFIYYPSYDIYDLSQYNGPRQNLKDEARVLHVKINCDINDKFGIPDIYRAIDWVKAHKDMAEDLATLIKSLSQYAWKKKIKGTASQTSAIAAAMKSKLNLTNLQNSAGQTQVENESVDLQSIDIKTGGVKVGTDGLKQMQLMICAASGIYHHYYGDPSTGNLATAKSMELPMMKKFTNYQSLWNEIYEKILDYVIDRKIEVGLLQGKVIEDPKARRRQYDPEGEIKYSIDFPPIIEQDLSQYATAMKTAKEANLMTEESAAKLFMLAANMTNVDEEIDKLEVEKEIKQNAQIEANKVAMQSPENINKKKEEVIPPVKEAIETPKKKLDLRSKKKESFVIQKMNGYRKSLAGHFRSMIKEAKRNLTIKQHEGKFYANVYSVHDVVSGLKRGMKDSARQYFPIAIDIGEKFMQANLKDLHPEIKLNETIYEAQGNAKNILYKRLLWNEHYINDSLEPDIVESIEKAMRTPYSSEALARDAIIGSLLKFESRIEQYVGAFWTVEEDAVKEAGRGTGVMVNFVGPDDSHNCEGCNSGVNGNPWPIDEAPVPGEQDCLGRCRHALQIVT